MDKYSFSQTKRTNCTGFKAWEDIFSKLFSYLEKTLKNIANICKLKNVFLNGIFGEKLPSNVM